MKKKYMKLLVSLPDEIYHTLQQNIPAGKRSGYIVKLIEDNLSKEAKEKKSFWQNIKKYRKGDFSHEDPVKIAKEAWDYVD